MASIKRQKLAGTVIEEIKRMIISGELKEGDKLPNQNAFAEQLGVSRPSLREALSTLSLLGAIEQRPGYGTVIKAQAPVLFADLLNTPFISDADATFELIASRRLIEAAMVELAAENATEKDIRKMEVLLDDMTGALEERRTDEYANLDIAYHYQIAGAAHNRFMLHFFVTMQSFMEQFIRETFSVLPGLYQRSHKFHFKIFKNIRLNLWSSCCS